MPRRSKDEVYRVITAVLAITEEAGAIALGDAAARVGVTRDELAAILEPVLYQEFRAEDGSLVSNTDAFLLDEGDTLRLTSDHWLRDLASDPPDLDTALRLLVAGSVMKSLSVASTPTLDRALLKLEQVVAADVLVALDAPECLAVVDRANRLSRNVRCRYVNDRGEARDREIEPWFVFSKWGRWYVHGRDAGADQVKWFRVDRMAGAEITDHRFTPAGAVAIPEWFELPAEPPVTLRVARAAVDNLPTPHRIDALTLLPDGRAEVTVTVHGRQRLEHLLVVLPPGAEVVDPVELGEVRRAHAARLLAAYG